MTNPRQELDELSPRDRYVDELEQVVMVLLSDLGGERAVMPIDVASVIDQGFSLEHVRTSAGHVWRLA